MNNRDRIEFYDDDQLIATVDSSMVPVAGSVINIRGQDWRILRSNFALDHADKPIEKQLCCCVQLEKI